MAKNPHFGASQEALDYCGLIDKISIKLYSTHKSETDLHIEGRIEMGVVVESRETVGMNGVEDGYRFVDLREGERLIIHTTRGATFMVNASRDVRFGKGRSGHVMGQLVSSIRVLVPGRRFVYALQGQHEVSHIIRAVHVYGGDKNAKLPNIWTLAKGHQEQVSCTMC